MININEIITCNCYADLPGVIPWGNFRGKQLYSAPPDNSIIFCTVDDIPRFFELHGDNGCTYNIISACSDFSIVEQNAYPYYNDMINALTLHMSESFKLTPQYISLPNISYQNFVKSSCNPRHKYSVKNVTCTYYTFPKIPSNIKKWMQTNVLCPEIFSDKIEIIPIPFGVGENDRDLLYEIMNKNYEKQNYIYVNFSPHTIERYKLLNQCAQLKNAGAPVTIHSSLDKRTYLEEMAQHKYVLCPPGFGIDTYRHWEAIYLGCVPIVDDAMASILKYYSIPYIIYSTFFCSSDIKRLKDYNFTINPPIVSNILERFV